MSKLRLRTSYALRYGRVTNDEGAAVAREGAVRAAFNSPYRPFVLTSTSIGQEGLDFHPWCHAIVHWNLPGNPVDLEQREGRVHRYEGHAVRRNVAARFAERAFATWRPGDDIWDVLFEHAAAAREPGTSDLVPWWVCPGEHRVQRRIPTLPYSERGSSGSPASGAIWSPTASRSASRGSKSSSSSCITPTSRSTASTRGPWT
ncbi:MAG: helicase-related protein [Sandaracinaceae bacterium]|nr:helicase-related protein [Sandaracinaceae bacterium]